MIKKVLIFFVIVFLLISCASSRYTKKATKLETMGQYTEAANLYYNALINKRTNQDAYTGLKRTGQMTLSKKLSAFNLAYNANKKEEAIKLYQEAENYYKKLSAVDVNLNFPSYYTDYYNEIKNSFIDEKYFEGMKYLQSENFSEAAKSFKEVVSLNPNYKDTKEQLSIAVNEPIYREATRLKNNNQYRKAYYEFLKLTENGNSYKDAFKLKNECLEKGTITIAIAPTKNNTSEYSINSLLENKITNKLKSNNNPFLKIVTETTNANLILQSEIVSYNYVPGTLQSKEERGYAKTVTRVLNKETGQYTNNTNYEKITYFTYTHQRKLNVTISYKLLKSNNKEICISDSKSTKYEDEIKYAKYSGNNYSNLVPGYWKSKSTTSKEDVVNDNILSVNLLKQLFTANTQIKDYNTMLDQAIEDVANNISKSVNSYILSHEN